MSILHFLQQRSSASKLQAPAPNAHEREQIFQAALRAPDHGRLKPWRFVMIEGDGLHRLGALFAEALQRKDPAATSDKLADMANKALRAPMIVVVVAVTQENHKVPVHEQKMSAACAAHAILLATEALGYGAIWRTGPMAEDPHVIQGLHLAAHESVVGYLYIGSRKEEKPLLQPMDVTSFVSNWP